MSDKFIESTISIEIPEFINKTVQSSQITFYKIEILNYISKQQWSLQKRYSEFASLYNKLCNIVPNVPLLPKKGLKKLTTYNDITNRRLDLNTFLKQCSIRKDIISNDFFKDFLEMNKNSPEIQYNSPMKLDEFTKLPLGIRDFYYHLPDSIMFIACSDMDITSRVDSYFSNLNMPWNSKKDKIETKISVGALYVFMVLTGNNSQRFFEAKYSKSFIEQTGVINYDSESRFLQIGLDSGSVVILKPTDKTYTKYEEITVIKPHKNRVMGIAYDNDNKFLYTCSTDKNCILWNFNTIESKGINVVESDYGFTNLLFDKKNKRLFLTNEGGIVSILLTSIYPLQIANVIQTHSSNCIRGLHINDLKGLLFTATNKGNISILDLGMPGKEKFVVEMTHFGGNVSIRIIKSIPDRNEVITGDQSGKITMWSLKIGQPIYAWQAHSHAITQIHYNTMNHTIITASKDKKIITWQLPHKWGNEEIESFEAKEVLLLNDRIASMNIQKTLMKMDNNEDNDDDCNISSDDSLTGWDIKEYKYDNNYNMT